MQTKVVVAILAVLGVLAALSTAVLAASLRVEPVRELINIAPTETTVLVASRDVSTMSVLELDAIAEKTVLNEDAPEVYFSDTAQITGRILVTNMVEGQPFTNSSFAREGSGAQLAGHLDPSTRAMTISFEDAAGLGRLLYPGCIVDILTAFRVSSSVSRGEAVSTTLLEAITVLAVDNLTVSDPSGTEENMASSKRSRKKLLITFLVDSKQAEALQLASLYGRISLTLRNPQDSDDVDNTATLLSQGAIARLANTLGTSVGNDPEQRADDVDSGGVATIERPSAKQTPMLDIEIYRGSDIESYTFADPTK